MESKSANISINGDRHGGEGEDAESVENESMAVAAPVGLVRLGLLPPSAWARIRSGLDALDKLGDLPCSSVVGVVDPGERMRVRGDPADRASPLSLK